MTSHHHLNIVVVTRFPLVQAEVYARLKRQAATVPSSLLPGIESMTVELAALHDSERLRAQMTECDIFVGEPSMVLTHLSAAKRLKLVHLVMAGADKTLTSHIDVSSTPFLVARAGGDSFGPDLSEFVIGEMIAYERHFSFWLQEQSAHRWIDRSKPYSIRSLHGLQVGILGASGSIGMHIARACQSFGMKVRGLSSKSPKEAAESVRAMQLKIQSSHLSDIAGGKVLLHDAVPEQLLIPFVSEWHQSTADADPNKPMHIPSEFFHDLDYLISVLPSTASTKGCLNGDVLAACRSSTLAPAKTIFISIGRGDVMTDESLLRALLGSNYHELLESGALPKADSDRYLRTVISDVFNQEPLPKDSPFYTLPPSLLTISPHVSGRTNYSDQQIANLIADNIQRLVNDEPLLYLLDKQKGY